MQAHKRVAPARISEEVAPKMVSSSATDAAGPSDPLLPVARGDEKERAAGWRKGSMISKQTQKSLKGVREVLRTPTLRLVRRFVHVAQVYFMGDARWKAWGLMGLMLALCVVSTGLLVVLSYVQRDFSTALSDKKKPAFYLAVWKFLGIVVVAAPLFAAYDYVQGLLIVEWREWLTSLLISNYFANRSYFSLKQENQLDNPDQRICDDVNSFVSGTVSIIVVITSKLLNSVAFAGVLWAVSPHLVAFLFGYAVFGTFAIMRIFGKKIMDLQYEGLQKQADFRYSLVRVRENAESIAFYRGDEREAHAVKDFLSHLIVILRQKLVWYRHLNLFNNFYEYLTIILPSMIVAPLYFSGQVEFGVISQTAFAFSRIFSAMTVIVSKFGEFSELATGVERLDSLITTLARFSGDRRLLSSHDYDYLEGYRDHRELKDVLGTESDMVELDAGKATGLGGKGSILGGPSSTLGGPGGEGGSLTGPLTEVGGGGRGRLEREVGEGSSALDVVTVASAQRISRVDGPGLRMTDLTLATPDGREVLFRGLSLALQEGESLLVVGPSGCGKSSLLRAIAGLWTIGGGMIESPKGTDAFFLPQKPYMPLGSLRAQLVFPHDEQSADRPTDLEVLSALEEVHLDFLPAKVGGLDAICAWADMLSSGEQQRVAFARMLLQRPQIAFLDEATSALDNANEARLYTLVKQRLPCYVSVGHRMSLTEYHSHILEYAESSGWLLRTAEEFLASRGVPVT